jgi:hypothetical protein
MLLEDLERQVVKSINSDTRPCPTTRQQLRRRRDAGRALLVGAVDLPLLCSPGRHCHSIYTAIGYHWLSFIRDSTQHTAILLSLLSFSSTMTMSPRATLLRAHAQPRLVNMAELLELPPQLQLSSRQPAVVRAHGALAPLGLELGLEPRPPLRL